MRDTDELASLEDQLGGLAERYRNAADSLQAACDQVRVMRETAEFSQERKDVLQGDGLQAVREWLTTLLPGADQ